MDSKRREREGERGERINRGTGAKRNKLRDTCEGEGERKTVIISKNYSHRISCKLQLHMYNSHITDFHKSIASHKCTCTH